MVHKTPFKAEKMILEKKRRHKFQKMIFLSNKKGKKWPKNRLFFPNSTKKGQKSSIKYSKGQEKNITKAKNDQKIVFLPK